MVKGTIDCAAVRGRIDIIDLVGRLTGQPVRVHGSTATSMCPNPNHAQTGRTPSGSIDIDRQLMNCFGCGFGGDSIDVIRVAGGLDRGAAIRVAADLARVEPTAWPFPPAKPRIVLPDRGPTGVITRNPNAVELRHTYAACRRWDPQTLDRIGVQVVNVDGQARIGIPVNPNRKEAGSQARLLDSTGRGTRWRTMRPVTEPFGAWQLDGLTLGDVVIIAEGASDYVAGACLHEADPRFPVVISAPGASAWRKGWAELLTGFTVVIIGDPDEAGRRYVATVAADCNAHGIATATASWPDDDDLCAYLANASTNINQTAQNLIDHITEMVTDTEELIAA
jgi:CHC2 zinc finger